MRSAGCISVDVRARFSAPPPDRHAIRLPAVHGKQLYGMALTGFSVKLPSCGLTIYQSRLIIYYGCSSLLCIPTV